MLHQNCIEFIVSLLIYFPQRYKVDTYFVFIKCYVVETPNEVLVFIVCSNIQSLSNWNIRQKFWFWKRRIIVCTKFTFKVESGCMLRKVLKTKGLLIYVPVVQSSKKLAYHAKTNCSCRKKQTSLP